MSQSISILNLLDLRISEKDRIHTEIEDFLLLFPFAGSAIIYSSLQHYFYQNIKIRSKKEILYGR